MRPLIYVSLLGAALLLLLLPLRGELIPHAAWVEAPQAVMAREGRYAQDLLPGETRTYVMEMAGCSLLKVRFSGSGWGLGLRIEDGEGNLMQSVAPAPAQDRQLGVMNPAGIARTLYLTVFRSAGPGHRRLVQSRGNGQPGPAEFLPVRDGSYALEMSREVLP